MDKQNPRFSKNHKIELSPDLEGVVEATAAWVYQKWAANASESVFYSVWKRFGSYISRKPSKFQVSSPSGKALTKVVLSIFGLRAQLSFN